MTDMGIIYAFIATIAGCLISIGAGVVAATRSRALAAKPPSIVPKPEHGKIPRLVFYGGGEAKPLSSIRHLDAQVDVLQIDFNADLTPQHAKPAAWINAPVVVSGKNRSIHQRLSTCPCG